MIEYRQHHDEGVGNDGSDMEPVKRDKQQNVKQKIEYVVDQANREGLRKDRVLVQELHDDEHQDRHQEHNDESQFLVVFFGQMYIEQSRDRAKKQKEDTDDHSRIIHLGIADLGITLQMHRLIAARIGNASKRILHVIGKPHCRDFLTDSPENAKSNVVHQLRIQIEIQCETQVLILLHFLDLDAVFLQDRIVLVQKLELQISLRRQHVARLRVRGKTDLHKIDMLLLRDKRLHERSLTIEHADRTRVFAHVRHRLSRIKDRCIKHHGKQQRNRNKQNDHPAPLVSGKTYRFFLELDQSKYLTPISFPFYLCHTPKSTLPNVTHDIFARGA